MRNKKMNLNLPMDFNVKVIRGVIEKLKDSSHELVLPTYGKLKRTKIALNTEDRALLETLANKCEVSVSELIRLNK